MTLINYVKDLYERIVSFLREKGEAPHINESQISVKDPLEERLATRHGFVADRGGNDALAGRIKAPSSAEKIQTREKSKKVNKVKHHGMATGSSDRLVVGKSRRAKAGRKKKRA